MVNDTMATKTIVKLQEEQGIVSNKFIQNVVFFG